MKKRIIKVELVPTEFVDGEDIWTAEEDWVEIKKMPAHEVLVIGDIVYDIILENKDETK